MKQVIEKLYLCYTEIYLKWKMQLDHVLKKRPCESGKEKLDMAEEMLDGGLLESWKLWRDTKSEKEKKGTFKKDDTVEVCKK